MPRLKHILNLETSFGLPAHLGRTYCGRLVNYGAQPNVPASDPRNCLRCRERQAAAAVEDLRVMTRRSAVRY